MGVAGQHAVLAQLVDLFRVAWYFGADFGLEADGVQAAPSRRLKKDAASGPQRRAVEKIVFFVALGTGEVFGASVAGVDDALALVRPNVDSGATAFFFARIGLAVGLLENDGE